MGRPDAVFRSFNDSTSLRLRQGRRYPEVLTVSLRDDRMGRTVLMPITPEQALVMARELIELAELAASEPATLPV